MSAAPSSTVRPSATSTRAILPQVVVLPAPLTPTTSTTAGHAVVRGGPQRPVQARVERVDQLLGEQRRAARRPVRVPSTRVRSRSRSTISRVASTPTSAVIRLSSISSQASSSRWSRASRPSRPLPKTFCERDSRERSRTSRPAVGSGTSRSAGASSTGGGSTRTPVDRSASGASTGGPARSSSARVSTSVRGSGGSGRRRSRGTTRPTAPAISTPSRTRATTRYSVMPKSCQMPATASQPPHPARGAAGTLAAGRRPNRRPVQEGSTACPSTGMPVTAHLLIGPLLRRVVGTRATIWVETSGARRGHRPHGRRRRRHRAHLLRVRPPLRAGGGERAHPGQRHHLRGAGRRRAWSGRLPSSGVPAQRDPHPGGRRPATSRSA